MSNTIFSAAAAAIALTVAAPAFAESETVKIEVDLTGAETVDGAREVYRSIQRQARDVCRSSNHARVPLHEQQAGRECERDLIERAVNQASRPLVTAMHTGSATRLAEVAK